MSFDHSIADGAPGGLHFSRAAEEDQMESGYGLDDSAAA